MAWVALVSGELFADLSLATVMLTAYMSGLGISARPVPDSVAPENAGVVILTVPMLLLLVLMGADFLYAVVTCDPRFYWNDRLALFFDHPNVLGYVAGWGVLYSLVRCRIASPRERFVWLALGVVSAAVVALAGARGVYLGLGLGAVAILLLLYRSKAIIILFASLLTVVLVGLLLPAQQHERIVSALSSPTEDITIRMRIPIWKAAMEGIQAAPLAGNGIRGFADHHQQYVAKNIEHLKTLSPVVEERVANPHNLYFGLLYAYGIIGVLLLIAAIGPAVCRTVRAGWLGNCGTDAAFFFASLCFLLGAGTVDYSLHRKDGIIMLFFTLALVRERCPLKPSSSASGSSEFPKKRLS